MVELEQKTPESKISKNIRSFEITDGEIIKLEGITDYKWQIYEPLLNALRAKRIQTESGEIQITPISRQIVKSFFPENTSWNLIYTTLQTLNIALAPNGWSIVRKGKTPRTPIDAPWFLTGPGDKLEKDSRNPASQKKPSRDSIPTLPHTQGIKPLPTSARIWDSEDANRRQHTENIKELRQGLKLDMTLSVLSLFKVDALGELNKKQRDSDIMSGNLPRGVSFYSVIGVDPKEDKETKERKRKEFVVTAVNETLDRLSGKQLKQISIPKERRILTICMDLQGMGKTIQNIKKALSEALGVGLPEGPNLTSSPAL